MPVRSLFRSVITFALVALIALGAAACASSVTPSAASPNAPSAAPSVLRAADPDALLKAAAANDGQQVQVPGFLLATDGKAQLCSLVLESYPPQCGGGTVRLIGQVPAGVLARLDKTSEPGLAQTTWGSVVVTGTFHASGVDGLPTIDISEIIIQPS